MFLTYTPDGEPPQRFEFRPGRVRLARAEMIEKRYGQLTGAKPATFEAWRMAVQQGSAAARRVLLWHLLSEIHPTIKIEDVDPFEDELLLEYSKAELLEMRAALEKAPGIPEAELGIMLGQLDVEIMTAAEDSSGKAKSSSSAPDIGSPSPS